MSSATSAKASGKPSRRACEFCQRRHLKCNGADLCDQCEYRGQPCGYKTDAAAPSSGNVASRGNRNTHDSDPAVERPIKRQKVAESSTESSMYVQYAPDVPKAMAFGSQMQLSYGMPESGHTRSPSLSPHLSGEFNSYSAPYDVASFRASVHTATSPLRQIPSPQPSFYNMLSDQYRSPSYAVPHNSAIHPAPHHIQYGPGNTPAPSYIPPQYHKIAPPPPSRLNPDLIVAYVRDVQPFSLTPYGLQDAIELHRFLQADRNQVALFDTFSLVKAFVECVMVAHGCRQMENPVVSQKYANKAYQTLVLILKSRLRAPDLVQNLGALLGGMDLLVIFMVGSDDLIQARFIIAEAYRVFTLYERFVPRMMAHRVMVLKIAAAARNPDVLYFLNEIKRLDIPADTDAGLGCHIALTSSISGRHPSRTEATGIAPILPQLTKEDQYVLEQALEIAALTEAAIDRMEYLRPKTEETLNVLRSYRAIVAGARCICYWQLGYVTQASAEAARLIQMGPAPPQGAKLGYLLAYCDAIQVMRCVGHQDLVDHGLSCIEPDLHIYPAIQRMYHELKEPLRVTDVPSTPSTPEIHAPQISQTYDPYSPSTQSNSLQQQAQYGANLYQAQGILSASAEAAQLLGTPNAPIDYHAFPSPRASSLFPHTSFSGLSQSEEMAPDSYAMVDELGF